MNTLFIIVPVYNVEKYLERCIKSLINQDYPYIKIILVDDGSRDTSSALCDMLSERYDNITVIHKENGGLSDARNHGIEKALEIGGDNDWLMFVDSDDFIRENCISRLIKLCEEYNAEVVQCSYEKGDANTFSYDNSEHNVVSIKAYDALLGYRIKSQAWAKMYKLKFFNGVRFPKGVWNEDEFTIYRLIDKAKRLVFTDEKLYYYFQHDASIMSTIAKKLKNNPHRMDWLQAYDERIKYFENKGETDQVLKTHEKICTDIILRYCEQMYLKKEDRDEDAVNGGYLSLYRKHFKIMIKRRNIPIKRAIMYIAFYIVPQSGVLMGRIFTLRK